MNSTRAKIKVTTRMVPGFSLLIKRRTTAPRIGKKISRDRMGIPKIVMKPTPFFSHRMIRMTTNYTNKESKRHLINSLSFGLFASLIKKSARDIIGYEDDTPGDHRKRIV